MTLRSKRAFEFTTIHPAGQYGELKDFGRADGTSLQHCAAILKTLDFLLTATKRTNLKVFSSENTGRRQGDSGVVDYFTRLLLLPNLIKARHRATGTDFSGKVALFIFKF